MTAALAGTAPTRADAPARRVGAWPLVGMAAAALVAGLVVDAATTAPAPKGDTVAVAVDGDLDLANYDVTYDVVARTWDTTTDTDRATICADVATFGARWAAEHYLSATAVGWNRDAIVDFLDVACGVTA